MLKKFLVSIVTVSFILSSFSGLNEHSEDRDELRQPFIPGREQNVF